MYRKVLNLQTSAEGQILWLADKLAEELGEGQML